MISFDMPVYYIGEEMEEYSLVYGKECFLWYSYGGLKGIEEIEITDSDFDNILSLSSEGMSPRDGKYLFGYQDLKDFVFEEDWIIINRDNRLKQLLDEEEAIL